MELAILLIVALLAMFIGLSILSLAVWRRLDEQVSRIEAHKKAYRQQVEALKEMERQGLQNWKKPND